MLTDPTPPVTRTEKYLYRLGGGAVEMPDRPLSRVEQYLNYLVRNGEDAEIPEWPSTRIEWYLAFLCQNWANVITSGAVITYKSSDGTETLFVERIKDGDDGSFVPDYYLDDNNQIIELVGWSNVPNGSVVQGIIQNVDTDVTVYAVFAGSGRYVPDRIAVTTNPSKTAYEDGETIDFTGLVVKAYLPNDSLWSDADHLDGVIPISELTFPVTTAIYPEDE